MVWVFSVRCYKIIGYTVTLAIPMNIYGTSLLKKSVKTTVMLVYVHNPPHMRRMKTQTCVWFHAAVYSRSPIGALLSAYRTIKHCTKRSIKRSRVLSKVESKKGTNQNNNVHTALGRNVTKKKNNKHTDMYAQ